MSSITITETLTPDQWDAFVYQHSKGSIFHTSQMIAVFRATKHYKPLTLAALNKNGEILALLVAVRIQTLPNPLGSISSRSIWYAEPLCSDSEQGVAALAELVAYHDKLFHHVLFTEIRPLWEAGAERQALERCGYEYKGYLNYIVDLRQSPEQIWSKLSKKCRYNIRSTLQRGVQIKEETSPESIDILYHFLHLSYDRARVPFADKSLFVAAQQILQPLGMLRIFVATYEDQPVAACTLLAYKQNLFLWYGGSQRSKTLQVGEHLYWHTLDWGAKNNYTLYDFGGAGWPDQPYGVRDFKAKFGGELTNYGRYRKIYSPWKLDLAERGYKFSQRLRGLQSQQPSATSKEG